MNWRRGLFRTWLVLTATWILIVGAFAYGHRSDLSAYSAFGLESNAIFAGLAILPPSFVFCLGVAALWIAAGFRRRPMI
jgi:hypothetical protein